MAKKRVLVQDDQMMYRGPSSALLQTRGFEVETAVNGLEGLEIAKAGDIAAVFSDVEMPNMNGFEFLARMRKNPATKDVPIVMCTTLNQPEHIEKAKKL